MQNLAIRLDDAEIGAYLRQLEDLEAQIDRAYSFDEQPFAEGKICPLDINNKPWAKFWTYRQITHVGAFKLMRNYTTDLPTVDILFEEFRRPIHKWGSSYYWTDDDIAAVMRMGESIEQEKIYAVQESAQQTMNKLIAYGDPALNLPGFINNPDILRSVAPYPLNSASTGEQQLAILHDCANAIVRLTKQVEKPDTMLLDVETYQFLTSSLIQTGTTTLNKTVLQHFLETNPYIKEIAVVNELDPVSQSEAGVSSPKRLIMAYKRDPMKVKAKVYQPLTFKEPRRVGIDSWVKPAVFKFGGVEWRRPLSAHVVELPE